MQQSPEVQQQRKHPDLQERGKAVTSNHEELQSRLGLFPPTSQAFRAGTMVGVRAVLARHASFPMQEYQRKARA